MRYIKLLFVLALCLVAWGASHAEIVVERPAYEGTNTNLLEITKVAVNDTVTVLDIHARQRPHYWIRIVSGSYIQTGEKRYPLIGAEGIEIDSLFWMPSTGEADFKLIFAPLPQDTETFTLIEGDDEGAFRIWGVDLVGKQDNDYPIGLPDELKTEPVDGPLPNVVFGCGKTTVNIHLLSDKNALAGNNFRFYYDSILGEQVELPLTFDVATGIATVEFDQIGSVNAVVLHDSRPIALMMLAPGETIDAYIDGHIIGFFANNSYIKYTENGFSVEINPYRRAANPHGYVYTNGHYANFNRMQDKYRFADRPTGANREYAFSYKMTGDEYTNEVERQYKESVQAINNTDLPQMMKELNIVSSQHHAIDLMNYPVQLLYVWDKATNQSRTLPPDSLNVKIEDRHLQQISQLFDINSPSLLIGSTMSSYLNGTRLNWPECSQIKMIKALKGMPKAADNGSLEISDEDRALIGESVVEMLMQRNQKALEKRKEMMSMIAPTPDVPLSQLFEAIIAPYKGKVVLIDLWNTWCSPCRYSIAQTEPLKYGELASDDLVWIYIANETSPIGKYVELVPNIKGVHYRLTQEQWDQLTLTDFPEVDGIPAYILVDRNGEATLRLDFRDHNLMKRTLKRLSQSFDGF